MVVKKTIALRHQRSQQEITVFLTNCHDIMFFQTVKDEDEEHLYKVYYSDQMSLSNGMAATYLHALLSSIYYHPMTGMSHFI